MGSIRTDRKPRANKRHFRGGGETRGGSSPPFGTPLTEEMRSLGCPAKNNFRGTITIKRGNLATSQVPFFRIWPK